MTFILLRAILRPPDHRDRLMVSRRRDGSTRAPSSRRVVPRTVAAVRPRAARPDPSDPIRHNRARRLRERERDPRHRARCRDCATGQEVARYSGVRNRHDRHSRSRRLAERLCRRGRNGTLAAGTRRGHEVLSTRTSGVFYTPTIPRRYGSHLPPHCVIRRRVRAHRTSPRHSVLAYRGSCHCHGWAYTTWNDPELAAAPGAGGGATQARSRVFEVGEENVSVPVGSGCRERQSSRWSVFVNTHVTCSPADTLTCTDRVARSPTLSSSSQTTAVNA